MPDYQYLNNTPRMNAIQDMGQTFGGLATALPQLQMQAQLFRQRMALQRAQELLNDQRMNESKARAKLYEGEQTLRAAQTTEAGARTEHVQGQEERERNIAQAALMMGQALSNRYQQQQMGGQQGPPTGEQDATMQAIQAASLLSARDPNMMARFVTGMEGTPHNVPPGNVLTMGGQPVYTNMQQTASQMAPRVVAPGGVVYEGGEPTYTNENMRVSSKGSSGMNTNVLAALDRIRKMREGGQPPNPDNMAAPPPAGAIYKGYRFKGGDPKMKENWEKVAQ